MHSSVSLPAADCSCCLIESTLSACALTGNKGPAVPDRCHLPVWVSHLWGDQNKAHSLWCQGQVPWHCKCWCFFLSLGKEVMVFQTLGFFFKRNGYFCLFVFQRGHLYCVGTCLMSIICLDFSSQNSFGLVPKWQLGKSKSFQNWFLSFSGRLA